MAGLPLKLIVGLGNPGANYARTRHNAGYWLVDELARRHGGSFRNESRHQGELARVRFGGSDVWLLKPTTFMNLSGQSIGSVAGFYRLPVGEILVAHDELDLPPGTTRLKEGGGHGGHNGLRDAIAVLGEKFWRLRIGIGHPGHRDQVSGYVLSRAPADEEQLLQEQVALAADILPLVLEQGAQKGMLKLHAKPAATVGGASASESGGKQPIGARDGRPPRN
ncbi:MAG: aminoacyl-tRNA hydrolase [Steroidobacteraceae bacterium]